jgi:uncharacterized SAM-binding protein YcdF (DUF218 family)
MAQIKPASPICHQRLRTARNTAKSALVVTRYLHIPRSRYALQRAGIHRVSTAHARFFEARDVYSIARELVVLPAYWLAR